MPVPSTPVVSVLVVAHERREFVAIALRSLEVQTLPRDQFEVLLLKDFEAPELDPQLERLGAQAVTLAPGPLGRWVAQVQDQVHGQLVAFLDDDDLFEPEKLERVVEDFGSEPRASYLHHATRPLRGPGARPPYPSNEPAQRAPIQNRTIAPAEWKSNFRGLWRSGAAFNLSSIVVRRQVLVEFPDWLERIEVSLSAYLFYATLRMSGWFLLDGRPLAKYRREEGFQRDGAPAPRSAERLSVLAGPRGADADVLLPFVAPLHFPASESPLRAARAQRNIVRALEGVDTSRWGMLAGLASAVRFRPWNALAAERVLFADAARFTISPQWGRRSWDRHRRGVPH